MQTVKTLSELLREFPDDMPVIIEVDGIRYELGAAILEEGGTLILTPQHRYADDGITPETVKLRGR